MQPCEKADFDGLWFYCLGRFGCIQWWSMIDSLVDGMVNVRIQLMARNSIESRQLEQVNDAWHRRSLFPAGDAFAVDLQVVDEWF